jgi:uncharacterized protein YfaT (DUF1175 family)
MNVKHCDWCKQEITGKMISVKEIVFWPVGKSGRLEGSVDFCSATHLIEWIDHKWIEIEGEK